MSQEFTKGKNNKQYMTESEVEHCNAAATDLELAGLAQEEQNMFAHLEHKSNRSSKDS